MIIVMWGKAPVSSRIRLADVLGITGLTKELEPNTWDRTAPRIEELPVQGLALDPAQIDVDLGSVRVQLLTIVCARQDQ